MHRTVVPTNLQSLTDSQLAELASSVLSGRQWARVEAEIVRRVEAGLTTEWTLA